MRGDDADDPTSYLVSFDDDEARYVVYTQTGFMLILPKLSIGKNFCSYNSPYDAASPHKT